MAEPSVVIEPAELNGYLASRGWRREGSRRGAGVWELESSGRLLVPDLIEFPDDDELVAEAVRKLAGIEQRSQREFSLISLNRWSTRSTSVRTRKLLPGRSHCHRGSKHSTAYTC